jgi:hypothetical protein
MLNYASTEVQSQPIEKVVFCLFLIGLATIGFARKAPSRSLLTNLRIYLFGWIILGIAILYLMSRS